MSLSVQFMSIAVEKEWFLTHVGTNMLIVSDGYTSTAGGVVRLFEAFVFLEELAAAGFKY